MSGGGGAAPSRRRPLVGHDWQVTRSLGVHAARHFAPGTLRAHGEGSVLKCLLLAPPPEWVALDVQSGALLRPSRGGSATPELFEGARPLDAFELTLAADDGPLDPARPEAVTVAAATQVVGARPRTVQRLLDHLVLPITDGRLLWTIGPSVSYAELTGDRPSVCLVSPRGGR
ncbi:MAG: hypothetical protein ACRDZT_05005, partial [Acidimicrobiales bacterium]